MSNLAIAIHLFGAVVMIFGGPLQLVPAISKRFPGFHRWNGRVYLFTLTTGTLSGLYLIWTTGSVGDITMHLATSLGGVLALFFAFQAIRYAIRRQIDIHWRWAMRMFLTASAVWFFRVILMFWILVNGGPAGFDPETFTGPFALFVSFAQFLLPLAVFEFYCYARNKRSSSQRYTASGVLILLTLATGVGIFGAMMGIWLPRI